MGRRRPLLVTKIISHFEKVLSNWPRSLHDLFWFHRIFEFAWNLPNSLVLSEKKETKMIEISDDVT